MSEDLYARVAALEEQLRAGPSLGDLPLGDLKRALEGQRLDGASDLLRPYSIGPGVHGHVPHCVVRRNANQTIANATWTDISFDTLVPEGDVPVGQGMASYAADMFSATGTKVKIRVPGVYVGVATWYWGSNGSGRRIANLLRNTGVVCRDERATTGSNPGGVLTAVRRCVFGDTWGFQLWQDSGGNLDVINDFSGGASPAMSVTWIGN